MRKIHAVSEGQYSSYYVKLLCATEEDAQRIIRHINTVEAQEADGYYSPFSEEFYYFDEGELPEHWVERTLYVHLHIDFDDPVPDTSEYPQMVEPVRWFNRVHWPWDDETPPRRMKLQFGFGAADRTRQGNVMVTGTDEQAIEKAMHDFLMEWKTLTPPQRLAKFGRNPNRDL